MINIQIIAERFLFEVSVVKRTYWNWNISIFVSYVRCTSPIEYLVQSFILNYFHMKCLICAKELFCISSYLISIVFRVSTLVLYYMIVHEYFLLIL